MNAINIIIEFFINPWNIGVIVIGGIFSLIAYNKYKYKNESSVLLYIPSVWTALGVLGTFVVLYYKLGHSEELNTDNIPQLIKDLSSAFSTSIIGVFVSLISSYLLKLNKIGEDKGKKWSTISINEMLWNQQEELKDLNGKFEGLTADIIEKLTENLGDVVKEYSKDVKQSFDDLNKAAKTSIEGLNSTLKESITKVIEDNLKTIKQTFSNIEDWQITSKEALDSTSEKFINAVKQYDDFKFNNEVTLDKLTEQIKEIEELKENTILLHDKISAYDQRNTKIEECLISSNNLMNKLSNTNGKNN